MNVARRDQYALPPGKARDAARVEEPFDLLVDAADRLDAAVLIDRAGHRERLIDRRLGERRQEGEKLGRRGAVAFHRAVRLLENQARTQ